MIKLYDTHVHAWYSKYIHTSTVSPCMYRHTIYSVIIILTFSTRCFIKIPNHIQCPCCLPIYIYTQYKHFKIILTLIYRACECVWVRDYVDFACTYMRACAVYICLLIGNVCISTSIHSQNHIKNKMSNAM